MTINYINHELYMEKVRLYDIISKVGTPTYVYSKACFMSRITRYMNALKKYQTATQKHQIHYAVKANSNLTILKNIAAENIGFDVVSFGELDRVIRANGSAKKNIFSGVSKTEYELNAAIALGIHCFNIESEAELNQIQYLAEHNKTMIDIAFRVNLDIDPKTHPYISTGLEKNKFGIDIPLAKKLYLVAAKSSVLRPIGVACHIGSQLTDLAPFSDALTRVFDLVSYLKKNNITLQHIDMGGGLGIPYEPTMIMPTIESYIDTLCSPLQGRSESLFLEPGRSIIGESGVLLTQVNLIKHQKNKTFAMIDAGMNDLLRPALYHAKHRICELKVRSGSAESYHVVGPVCETSDQFCSHHLMIKPGDYLSILDVGAYGMSMASNYNTRLKPAEVLVTDNTWHVIRQRGSYHDLCQLEKI